MQELFSCVGGGVDVVLLFWSWDPEAVRERERERVELSHFPYM